MQIKTKMKRVAFLRQAWVSTSEYQIRSLRRNSNFDEYGDIRDRTQKSSSALQVCSQALHNVWWWYCLIYQQGNHMFFRYAGVSWLTRKIKQRAWNMYVAQHWKSTKSAWLKVATKVEVWTCTTIRSKNQAARSIDRAPCCIKYDRSITLCLYYRNCMF